ncbi:MAG: hypothetical protein RL154_50 [Pseudomonadota bacterium]
MCGIFGIIGRYDSAKVKTSLHKMLNRGPDCSKIVEFKSGCFAQNRLSIIAPSHKYDPPFTIENKYFIFNGELYNFKELSPNQTSDSMAAFELFDSNKESFLKNANGMFAFALFNQDTNKLTLVRDRFGKKPLYYTLQDGVFIFASSIDAIAPHITAKFNKEALKSYLSYHAPIKQETFYKDIYKVPAGSILEYDGAKIVVTKYFELLNEQEDSKSIEELLFDSINKRLVADCEVGAFLSGGVDSSTVCAVASRFLAQNSKKLQTFCIGYDNFEKDDERYFANITAKKIGSIHHEIPFSKNDFLDSLQKCIEAFDEPISDPTAVPYNFLCNAVSQNGIKTVLSGEGGDEAFLGYSKYEFFAQINNAKKLPFASYLGGFFERHEEQNREWEWYKRAFSDDILYRSMAESSTDRQKIALLNQNVSSQNSATLIKNYYSNFLNSHHSDYSVWMSYIDIKIWLSEVLLQKADKIGMANSLEIRCPFMEYKVLAKCIKLGDARFAKTNKLILKNIMNDLLPNEILNRDKKGFSYPFNKWLFEIGDPEVVFELNIKTQFFHKKYLNFLFNQAKRGSFKHQFWGVYIFSKWYISRFC